MAYTVMIILVSPAVPSPATTLTSKHTIQPPHFMVPLTALLFTNAADLVRAHQWIIASQPKYLALHGSDLVDLNTARLC